VSSWSDDLGSEDLCECLLVGPDELADGSLDQSCEPDLRNQMVSVAVDPHAQARRTAAVDPGRGDDVDALHRGVAQ
jgi:hypothetical protein